MTICFFKKYGEILLENYEGKKMFYKNEISLIKLTVTL